MLKLYLMLVLLAAAVFAESVRETETWVPVKSKSPHEDLESSGDSSNGDFEFSDAKLAPDDEDAYKEYVDNGYEDNDDDEDDDYSDYDMSGSGYSDVITSLEEGEDTNDIPDLEPPFAPKPTIDERVLVEKNEVAVKAAPRDNHASHNVLMSHAGEDSMFNNKEVLAAVIAGGIVGLIFGVILIVVLVHFVLRIKKKDEGSYDLGKTPIYKKAPTTEIYA